MIDGSAVSGGTGATWSAVSALTRELLDDGLACAPHVLAALVDQLHANHATIREVVALLSRGQRQGLVPLPSPLPTVPSIVSAFGGLRLPDQDRALVVAISTALTDDLTALLAFDGRSAAEIAASALGPHLIIRAGRLRFTDRRLGVWATGRATAVELAQAHARLAQVLERRGAAAEAGWHRVQASLEIDPDGARRLVRASHRLFAEGDVDRALLLAGEAAVHARGDVLDEARLAAGSAALGAGFASEAARWLGALFPHGAERFRLRALPGLIIARTHLQGTVPDAAATALRPSSLHGGDWRFLAHAAALAVPLCAERNDRRGLRAWMEELREASRRSGSESTLRDPAVELAWLLLGESEHSERGAALESTTLTAALTDAAEGRIDAGVALLAHDRIAGARTEALVAGFEHTPLAQAYRAVAHVLLLVWRGEIGSARDLLVDAALRLPIALPFAGLGVVLARRLDLAVHGELGTLARGLTEALPSTRGIDLLIDQGLVDFLAGDFEGAARSVRLWREIGAPQSAFAVPGLEEIRPGDDEPDAAAVVEPPDERVARTLRTRVATAPDVCWPSERAAVADAARALRSAFARGRIEAMLGTRSAIRDERLLARDHLRTALRLFELSGARAWARSVERRLSDLDGDSPASMDPLASCRLAWSPLLTSRELDVALRAAVGASNREIADELTVSVRTVEVHLGRAFAKIGVRSRVELTVVAHRTDRLL